MSATFETFEGLMRQGGAAALERVEEFFMREDAVHKTMRAIAVLLDALKIPYAVVGGMALVAHGYDRTTTDVDILVTPESLDEIHRQLDGFGYVPPFAGSKHLRDAATKVKIEFLTSGGFPGDGKPKPVQFPNPKDVSLEIGGIKYINVPTLIDLKLASGMTGGAHRLKDLADVAELIKALNLPRTISDDLNPYTRTKYLELWDDLQTPIAPG